VSEYSSLAFDADANVVNLLGDITFETVQTLLKESALLFEPITSLTIDLAGATRSDSAGLALLIHWIRLAKHNNKKIIFRHIPKQMMAVAQAGGVSELLPIQNEAEFK